MKKNLLAILLCMVVSATVSAQQTTPPIFEYGQADNELLYRMVQQMTDLNTTTEGVGDSLSSGYNVAREFFLDHLSREKDYQHFYQTDLCGGHTVYAYPRSAVVMAQWQYPGKKKNDAPIVGQSLYAPNYGTSSNGLVFMSSYTTQKAKSKGVVVNTKDPLTQGLVSYVKERIETQSVYHSLVAIDYYPLPVLIHFDDVRPLHNGAAETVATLRLTDARDQYVLDGYEITLTNKSPDVIDLCRTTVTTDSCGRAIIRAYGLKEGQARIVATIEYSDDQRKTRLFEEKELTIEVKKKSGLHVEATLHDASRAVAVDFHISFDVRYSSECGTDSVTVEAGKATITSAGGTEEVPCEGGIAQGLFRLCFVTDGVMVYSSYAAVRSEVLGAFRKGFGAMLRSAIVGQIPPNSTVPMYNTPTEIQFPGTPGVYSYHITARGMMDAGQAGNKIVLVNKTMVMPALKKILSCTEDYAYFSAVGNGGGPYWSGTITVTEIED